METVLIVEDDRNTLEALAELLAIEGHSSTCATNGEEALDKLDAGLRPCLILLDLMMPVMSGWEFRRRQLLEPRWADIPVVVLSAAIDLPSKAQQLRAAAFLPKPIDLSAFYNVLSRYC